MASSNAGSPASSTPRSLATPRARVTDDTARHGFELGQYQNFDFQVVASCRNQEYLDWAEIEIGLRENALAPNGYNKRLGNGKGATSSEFRRQQSERFLGRPGSQVLLLV